SGIDVKILVPKIPDKKMVFKMTRAHYGDLLKAGVKIYEYTAGFNHAKNIIVDDKMAMVGTVNIDYRSLLLHFECADFMAFDSSIIQMKNDFLNAIKESELITHEAWQKRSMFEKFVGFWLNVISPLL
ncbi:MAG: phospholipase D-like domain-containing protein, partial [Clostridia bacterium]